MNLDKTGLVLEGGGLRGVYTSGVLRFLMDIDLYFPYVIGVSMGACNAASYVSRQPERNRIVNIRYVRDKRYLSYRRLFSSGELFGMDFAFGTIPEKLVPFDTDTFMSTDQRCVTTVTDCHTGEPLYFDQRELGDDYLRVLQASSSLPFVAKPVEYRGHVLMDGGISDSIPVEKSMEDGNTRNVIILTQPAGYRKKPSALSLLARFKYPEYKGMCRGLETRYKKYNKTLELIEGLEDEGKVFIIRPEHDLGIARTERDRQKLYLAYDKGYEDAKRAKSDLYNYLGDPSHSTKQRSR